MLSFGLRGARRLSGFAASTILLAVASLVLMPAIIGAAGLETWSSIVLGHALAQIVALVVGCGYGANGPAIVSTLTPEEAVNYFRVAERTRFAIAVPCFAFMIAAMFIIPNPHPIAGLLGGAHLAIGALNGSFFYVGRGAPLWLLITQTIPRAGLMFAAAVSLALGAPLLVGLTLPVLGATLAIVISNLTIRRSVGHTTGELRSNKVTGVIAELRTQLLPTVSAVIRGGTNALPVFVVTAVAPGLLGAFGVFDRLQRQATPALSPVISTLQGWVPRRMAADSSARPVVAALVASFAGAAALVLIFVWLGGPLISWLAAGKLKPTFGEVFLCGLVIATSMLIHVVAYACLVPLAGIRRVIPGDVVGIVTTLIALPIMLILESSVASALGALAIGNVSQLVVQLLMLVKTHRSG